MEKGGNPPPGKGASPPRKTIKVVERIRASLDPLSADEGELRATLEALSADAASRNVANPGAPAPVDPQSYLSFLEVARLTRAARATLPTSPTPEVLLRQVMFEPAVWAVVAVPGDSPPDRRAVRARPGAWTQGVTLGGEPQGLAVEEPILVYGLGFAPAAYGSLQLWNLSGGFNPGYPAMLASGVFGWETASVVGKTATPQPPIDPRGLGGLAFLPRGAYFDDRPELTEEAGRQLAAAAGYHASPAAARLVALAAGGRRAGLPSAILLRPEPPPAVPGDPFRPEALWYLDRLAEIYPQLRREPAPYRAAPYAQMFAVRALQDFLFVLTEGRDALRVQDFLSRTALARRGEALFARVRKDLRELVTRARQYLIIIEDKLGSARVLALREAVQARRIRSLDEPDAVLSFLRPREKEIVETEYKNRRLEWEGQVGNKCPHVRLALRLRAVTSSREAMQILEKLTPYIRGRVPGTRRGAAQPAPAPGAVAPAREPPARTDWLLCRNCGFRIICPHVEELIRMQAQNLPYEEIRARLARYAQKYSTPRPEDPRRGSARNTFTYFCRICSEQLSELFSEDRTAEILGATGELDDFLRRVLWVEAAEAARHLTFSAPVDPRNFASTAARICYPLLLRSEEKTLKLGRRAGTVVPAAVPAGTAAEDVEQVAPSTRLRAVLFVYAYVLSLIVGRRGRGRASGTLEVRLEGVKPDAQVSAYVAQILRLVVKEKSFLLSQLEDITNELLAMQFRETYRTLTVGAPDLELTTADEAQVFLAEIVPVDPVYQYAVDAARALKVLPLGADAKTDFETALGRPLPKILAEKPRGVSSLICNREGRRVVLEFPPGVDPVFVYKEPESSLWGKIYRVGLEALKRSAKDVEGLKKFERLASAWAAAPAETPGLRTWPGGAAAPARAPEPPRARDKPRPAPSPRSRPSRSQPSRSQPSRSQPFRRQDADIAALAPPLFVGAYRLFVEYTTKLSSASDWEHYLTSSREVRNANRSFEWLKALKAARPRSSFGFPQLELPSGPRAFSPVPIAITDLYDEQGAAHRWGIYVYRRSPPEPAETVELTRPQILEMLAEAARESPPGPPPLRGLALLDLRCSVCHVLRSETDTLDPAKTKKSLRALTELNNFFSFYADRCPVEGLHEFVGGPSAACRKCELPEGLTPGGDPARAREYYHRYSDRYAQEIGEISFQTKPAPRAVELPLEELPPGVRGAAASWRFEYRRVLDAARLAGVEPAVVEAIGATERRDYDDVRRGVDPPPPPADPDDPRIYAADSDVRLFSADYSSLRHFHELVRQPPRLGELLKKAGAPPSEHRRLPEFLPDVFQDYTTIFREILRTRPAADALQFAIESLCRMALQVAGAEGGGPSAAEAPGWLSALRREFAVGELRLIFRSERLLSKPGQFNFLIFSGEGVESAAFGTSDDQYDQGEAGAAGEDILQQIEETGGEDGALAPFSLEGMDYDEEVAEANESPI